MRFVVLGGGCYGSFYARQLLRADAAGAVTLDAVLVVDRDAQCRAARELHDPRIHVVARDWAEFLDEFVESLEPDADDTIVPPPFTPHLALAWLLSALRRERPDLRWDLEPFRALPGTPFERQSPGGPLLLSHADWVCPVHCIEPDTCPKTRGPRHWDMARTAEQLAERLTRHGQAVHHVQLFCCHHLTHGVGGYPARRLPEARRALLAAAGTIESEDDALRFIVGTVSRCHGALNLLTAELGTLPEAPAATPSRFGSPHVTGRPKP